MRGGNQKGAISSWYSVERVKSLFDRWLRDYPRATPIAVFVIATFLVLSAAGAVQRAGYNSHIASVRAQAKEIVSAIEQQGASTSAYLASTSAFFSTLDTVSPALFHNFVDRVRIFYALDGVVGVGWSQALPEKQLPAWEARWRREGLGPMRVRPRIEPQNGVLHVITMLEPRTPDNLAVLGFNMHSEARRAAAMDKAERTNSLSATDPVKLVQDEGRANSPGFLVFAPVITREGAWRLRGFAYSPIRTADFIEAAVSRRLRNSGRIELYDATSNGRELIYSSQPQATAFDAAVEERITLFDQQWTLRYAAPAHSALYPFTLVVLIGGTSFALLLLAYVLLVQRRNDDLFAMVTAQTEREVERAGFVRELNHRVKNTLANVTSMISLTKRNATSLDGFAAALLDRVRALASSHSLLDGGQWGPTDIRLLVESQLGSFRKAEGRIVMNGPDELISPNDALTLGLALHELATNAVRHGALSAEQGQVTLDWMLQEDGWIRVSWVESGGPTVEKPARYGFGLNLLERALAHGLDRPISIAFPPEGVQVSFFIPRREAREFRFRS